MEGFRGPSPKTSPERLHVTQGLASTFSSAPGRFTIKNIFFLSDLFLSFNNHGSPAGFTFFPLVEKVAGMFLALSLSLDFKGARGHHQRTV